MLDCGTSAPCSLKPRKGDALKFHASALRSPPPPPQGLNLELLSSVGAASPFFRWYVGQLDMSFLRLLLDVSMPWEIRLNPTKAAGASPG